MNQLPEQPAETAGQPTAHDYAEARRLLAALDHIPTSFRDETPVPPVGTALPVPQPGRPPMSQRATDTSALILSVGAASLPFGAAVTGILWASGNADPLVVGLLFGAPTALALALARLFRTAKQAEPDVHHHHYEGAQIVQDHSTTNTRTTGLWASTRNQLPRG